MNDEPATAARQRPAEPDDELIVAEHERLPLRGRRRGARSPGSGRGQWSAVSFRPCLDAVAAPSHGRGATRSSSIAAATLRPRRAVPRITVLKGQMTR
jgi:hypothetical protein